MPSREEGSSLLNGKDRSLICIYYTPGLLHHLWKHSLGITIAFCYDWSQAQKLGDFPAATLVKPPPCQGLRPAQGESELSSV